MRHPEIGDRAKFASSILVGHYWDEISEPLNPAATLANCTTVFNVHVSGGSTAQSAAVIVSRRPASLGIGRSRSLSTIRRSFRSEAQKLCALVFMDGSLYAGIGDPGDPQANTPLDSRWSSRRTPDSAKSLHPHYRRLVVAGKPCIPLGSGLRAAWTHDGTEHRAARRRLSAHHRPILTRSCSGRLFERQGNGVDPSFPAGPAETLPSFRLPTSPTVPTLPTSKMG